MIAFRFEQLKGDKHLVLRTVAVSSKYSGSQLWIMEGAKFGVGYGAEVKRK